MFDISSVKKQAKMQLKGNYLTPLAASIIVYAIFFVLNLASVKIKSSMPSLVFTFTIIKFCINSLLSFALWFLCIKIVKTNGNEVFSDFTDGLTQFKPAILGSLWYVLFIILWTFLCIIPFSIILPIIIAIFSIQMFDFSNFSGSFSFSQTFNNFNDVNTFFKNMFTNYLGIALVIVIALLAVIIVIFIKFMSYSFMPVILAEFSHEHKDVHVNKAMRLSIEITKGHLGELVGFAFSFLGWFILCCIPAAVLSSLNEVITNQKLLHMISSFVTSIAFAFVIPYIQTAYVNAYLNLKQYAINTGRIKPEDLK